MPASEAVDPGLERLDQKQYIERCYNRLFNSPDGQIVLEDLAKVCHIDNPAYVVGQPDALLLNEGMRMVFLTIIERAGLKLTKRYLDKVKAQLPAVESAS